jgi:hypothetical protein
MVLIVMLVVLVPLFGVRFVISAEFGGVGVVMLRDRVGRLLDFRGFDGSAKAFRVGGMGRKKR